MNKNNKTHSYAAYKRLTSYLRQHTDSKEREEKRYSIQMENTSDKIDFKMKTVEKDKEEHYIMIIESIQQEDITYVNVYAFNI